MRGRSRHNHCVESRDLKSHMERVAGLIQWHTRSAHYRLASSKSRVCFMAWHFTAQRPLCFTPQHRVLERVRFSQFLGVLALSQFLGLTPDRAVYSLAEKQHFSACSCQYYFRNPGRIKIIPPTSFKYVVSEYSATSYRHNFSPRDG